MNSRLAPGRPAQHRQRRLGGDQHGAQIEVERELDIGHVDALDRGRARMTDMVPYEIERAERRDGAVDDVPGEAVLAQVAGQAERPGRRRP